MNDKTQKQCSFLYQNIEAPEDLWHMVYSGIRRVESEQKKIVYIRKVIAIAAVFILTITAGILYRNTSDYRNLTPGKAGVMASDLRKDIWKAQNKYEKAIAKYQTVVLQDTSLSNSPEAQPLLEKLALMDGLIVECKNELSMNPYYPPIHQTLIFAYQQKLIILGMLDNRGDES
jgi:hypothetical protein